MRRLTSGLMLLAALGSSLHAAAQQPSASATAAASAAPSAAASASASPGADGELPPGHPPTGDMPPSHPPTGDMPPGHPPTGGMPAGHGAGGQDRGFFQPQPDQVLVDPSSTPGSVQVSILDADQRPVPNAPITLSILKSSVTKGESRNELNVVADETGRYRFEGLDHGSGISYVVRSSRGGAEFATPPFGLKEESGVRAMLHVYDPVTDLKTAAVVMELIIIMEVKQSNIAINHLLRTLNFGRTAFVTDNLSMPLPPEFEAFSQPEETDGVSAEERDGRLVISGTFPPGQREITFRYQIPLSGDAAESFELPIPPRTAATRVRIGAGPKMTLQVAGYPDAQEQRFRDQRILETGQQVQLSQGVQEFMADTSPKRIKVTIGGLPTTGNSGYVAVALALMALGIGVSNTLLTGTGKSDKSSARERLEDLEEARDALLEDVALLERARRTKEVGPRTYERVHKALLEALARIVAQIEDVQDLLKGRQALDREGDDVPPKPKRRKKKKTKKRRRKRGATAST